jgi:hypothetical protein
MSEDAYAHMRAIQVVDFVRARIKTMASTSGKEVQNERRAGEPAIFSESGPGSRDQF